MYEKTLLELWRRIDKVFGRISLKDNNGFIYDTTVCSIGILVGAMSCEDTDLLIGFVKVVIMFILGFFAFGLLDHCQHINLFNCLIKFVLPISAPVLSIYIRFLLSESLNVVSVNFVSYLVECCLVPALIYCGLKYYCSKSLNKK